MTEEFQTGISLMLTGMITVFVILWLVVLLGRLIISLVNRYFPAEVAVSGKPVSVPAKQEKSKKMAAIAAAVNIVTRGKGKIFSIISKE